jgi:outer membrane immunogenic protein
MLLRTIVLALLACFGIVVPALAGDIASPTLPFAGNTKANAMNPCQLPTATTPLSCTGFYIGAGLGGAGSNADIIGSGINGSVFAGGITPTLDAGWQYVQGNWVFGIEFDAGYSVGTGANVNGVGNGFNGFRTAEVFKVGGNLAGLLGTQTPITIPASLSNAILAPYAHVDGVQWQLPGAWAGGLGSGAGILFDFGPRVFGDLRYTYTNFNGAKASGVTVQNDKSLLFTVNYKLN